ncbi:hypothetical protein LCGC14_2621460 [marine sediment metagenome]|uniref:Uncharacterized protein n=1 Tax=marine sediment metagenome TaxID=412755 RepID=A0A0F9CVJ2_9ZZZZ
MVYLDTMKKEWLENLKVGDRVVINTTSYGSQGDNSVSVVERLTKTLIITKGGRKFRRNDGLSPGGEWSKDTLQEPTPEAVDRIRQANLANKLRHYDWKPLPLATLRAIYDLLPKST